MVYPSNYYRGGIMKTLYMSYLGGLVMKKLIVCLMVLTLVMTGCIRETIDVSGIYLTPKEITLYLS